jgi:ribosomal protein S18 acetylase RimI-like enzyme
MSFIIKKLNTKDAIVAAQITYLQKKSFYVESQLIEYSDVVGLTETEEDILKCTDTYLGYKNEQGELLGILSYEFREDDVFIVKLAVLPSEFRKGIASQLLEYFLQLNHQREKIMLETSFRNTPALNLYQKYGFSRVDKYFLESKGQLVAISILEKTL